MQDGLNDGARPDALMPKLGLSLELLLSDSQTSAHM